MIKHAISGLLYWPPLSLPLLLGTVSAASPSLESHRTLLVENARVWGHAGATTVLVVNDRIAAVGGVDPGARAGDRIDAAGGLVLPGFHDAHIHMQEGGLSLIRLDLSDEDTLEAVLAHIERYAEEQADLPWILGRGWQYGIVPTGSFPTRQMLDRVVPDRPVFLRSYDEHTGWANSKALALAGIGKETEDPESGTLVRDESGEPTGALLEDAQGLMNTAVPKPTRAERKRALLVAAEHVLRLGVTAVDDVADDIERLELWCELEEEGALPIRVRVSPPLETDLDLLAQARARCGTGLVSFGFLKGFVDGVVESKTAYMLRPYAGTQAEVGRPLIPRERLYTLVERAHARGFQVALHSIGDAAVRLALDAYEHAIRAHPEIRVRHRVEHIEVLDPADAARFEVLGVIASMQPFHANPFGDEPEKGPWAENLGPSRWPMTMAWRTILDAGGALAFGSDWPVYTADPLQGLAVALTRRDERGRPERGWTAHQTIQLDQAIHAYTVERGEAGGASTDVGALAVGQRADLVVLDPRVDLADPRTLWTAKVTAAVVDGAPRFRRGH